MKNLLWIAFTLLVGTYLCGPILDPDLWWHITAGRWILAHGQIPEVDYWSHFWVGKPWRAYSWSNEIVYAWIDKHYAIQGLLVLQLVLGILIAFALALSLSVIAGDYFFGALLGAFVACGTISHFTLRPQSLIWILLVALLAVADQISKHGLSRARGLAIVLLMSVWANSHITSILGMIALGLWIYAPGKGSLAFKATMLALLGTLITPYFGGEWLTFFSKTGHPFDHRSIAEFGSSTIMQFPTAFLLIAAAFVAAFWHHRPRMVEPTRLLLGAGFAFAGLAVVKFMPFALIVLAAIAASYWARSETQRLQLGNLAEAFERLKNLIAKVPTEGLTFIFLCLVVVNIVQCWRDPLDYQITPVEAADFIEKNALPNPVMNSFGQGGYLMYRWSDAEGNPKQLVTLDGRTNTIPQDVWRKFSDSFDGKKNWKEFIDLINPATILWRSDSPLISVLLATGNWKEVFRSGNDNFGHVVLVSREVCQGLALKAVVGADACK